MSSSSSLPHIDNIKDVARSQWLTLQSVEFTDRRGKRRLWDRYIRTSEKLRKSMIALNQNVILPECSNTTPFEGEVNKATADATAIIGLTYKSSINEPLSSNNTEVLLIKQFRPASCGYTIEFPAGLIDDGEDAVMTGLRELTEETGYTAHKVIHVSPSLVLSPGAGAESIVLIVVLIDLDDPKNKNPQPSLHEGEDIEVFRIPLSNLTEELKKFDREKNVWVFDEVYCVAFGLSLLQNLFKEHNSSL